MQQPLTPGNGTAPPRFRIGDLEVDIGTAEVTRGGEKIALPKLSFDLLCALINAAPAIVTNDELLQQVWPGLMVSPESVAQRVKLLRNAIGDDSQQPRYILGVRGRGYRLIPVPERLAESGQSASGTTISTVHTPSVTEAARQESAPSRRAEPRKPFRVPRRVGIVAAVLLALGAAAVLGWHYWPPVRKTAQSSTVAMADKPIAVLPFVDLSEKKDQEYFGDGMAEEIIDLLVKAPGLKVIGRTSSFQFKNQSQDLRTIGEKLGARYVLEGSVRKSGDRLRVTAQLIDSRTGTHLFSQTYDRDLSDVLKLQDEIAMKIARALQVEVHVNSYMLSRPTLHSKEAYTLFLKGTHAVNRYEQQGWEEAVNDFKRALDLDPSFAEAAFALADLYHDGGQFGYVSREVAFEKARQFSELALKLDPSSVGPHAELGDIYGSYAWDWAAADKEINLAVALAPNSSSTLWAATVHSLTLGRWDDAVNFALALQEINPLDPWGYFWVNAVQQRRGRLVEAEAAIRRALEISPTLIYGYYALGYTLLLRGQPDAALTEFLKEGEDSGRDIGAAIAYFALGRRADSDAALAQSLKRNFPSGIAAVYAYREEPDEAFKWLDRAFAEKDPILYRIKYSTDFDKLHGDPRYKAFLKKMNLPE